MEDAAATGTSLIVTILIILIVGAIAGWLAGVVVKGGGYGFIGNAVLGIVGAVVASFIFRALGIMTGGGIIGGILAAAFGAVVVLVILRMIKRA